MFAFRGVAAMKDRRDAADSDETPGPNSAAGQLVGVVDDHFVGVEHVRVERPHRDDVVASDHSSPAQCRRAPRVRSCPPPRSIARLLRFLCLRLPTSAHAVERRASATASGSLSRAYRERIESVS